MAQEYLFRRLVFLLGEVEAGQAGAHTVRRIMHTGPAARAQSCVVWMLWTLCVCCIVVIWPGFLGEYVLSRDCVRRMGKGKVSGARGREKGKQGCGSRPRGWSLRFLLSCSWHVHCVLVVV